MTALPGAEAGGMAGYESASRFVLRSPLLPFDELLHWSRGLVSAAMAGSESPAYPDAWAADCRLLRSRLQATFRRPLLKEALHLASPDLTKGLAVWRETPDGRKGRRVEEGLVRYYQRMAARPTPFGLFAGCSTGRVEEATRLRLAPLTTYRRHSRLDLSYLHHLADRWALESELRSSLLFAPNPTLYELGGRLRYVERRHTAEEEGAGGKTERGFQLVALEHSEALLRVLGPARRGAPLSHLAAALTAAGRRGELGPRATSITPREAMAFLEELAASQVLLPELQPRVTGGDRIAGLLDRLRGLSEHGPLVAALSAARAQLVELDRCLVSREGSYASLTGSLAPLGISVSLPRQLQVDLYKPAPELTLGRRVVDELARGVELLRCLTEPHPSPLDRFADAFAERYGEGREVPLLQALDEELGVGFDPLPAGRADIAPLLEDLPPRRPSSGRERAGEEATRRDDALLALLDRARRRGAWEVELEDGDLAALEAADPPRLPTAFYVRAGLAAASSEAVDHGRFNVLLHGAAGPSGATLLGRFCHGDAEIHRLVADHLAAEEAAEPDVVFAEIVHLPHGRAGNVLARPVLRSWEIPLLGGSGARRDRQLPLSDLTVRVVGRRVEIRSRRLCRRVVPRLTSAHTAVRENLGIYRFLVACQEPEAAGYLTWSWGRLEASRFLPRVRRGRLILTRARIRLDPEELAAFASGVGAGAAGSRAPGAEEGSRRFQRVQAWRRRLRAPRFLALTEGDNELPVDLDNPLSVEAWLARADPQAGCVLTELFPGPGELPLEGEEGSYRHEIILPFVRRTPALGSPARTPFVPGPEDPGGADPAPTGTEEAPPGAPPVEEPSMEEPPVEEPPVEEPPSGPPRQSPVERSFPPGSRWLYAKVYTGTSSADRLLRGELGSLARRAGSDGRTKRWYFLRYADPQWHLRLRFDIAPDGSHRAAKDLLAELHDCLRRPRERGEVWKVQLDTYEREVERYGGAEGFELAEELFHRDSECVLRLLDLLEGDAGPDARWRLALLGIDRLLFDFGLAPAERRALAEHLRDAAERSLRLSREDVGAARSALADRLRAERPSLDALLNTVRFQGARLPGELAGEEPEAAPPLPPSLRAGAAIFEVRSRALAPVVAELRRRDRRGRLAPRLAQVMPSFLHLFVNRLTRSAGKEHEYLLYDLLARLHASRLARARSLRGRSRPTAKP